MVTADRYARCVAERTISPPLTSGGTLHWDGIGAVSRVWRLQKEALSSLSALHSLPAVEERCPMFSSQSSTIDWDMQAAAVTFYLTPVLLRDAAHGVPTGVVGVLVWVCREEHAVSPPPQYSQHYSCILFPQLSRHSTSNSCRTSTPVILCSITSH